LAEQFSNTGNSKTRLYEFGPKTRKIFVVGDLHGYFKGFSVPVESWRKEKGSFIIFLGDYADRGPRGLEIIESLIALSSRDNLVLLKGNHEYYSSEGQPRFRGCTLISEVSERRGSWDSYFQNTLRPFLDDLYLAALLPHEILFVHGGVSSRTRNAEDLKYPKGEIEKDILWSDPSDEPGERKGPRSAGRLFGPEITEAVLNGIGVKAIIRGHEPYLASNGPLMAHNGKIMTISSTDIYGGKPYYLEIDVNDKSWVTNIRYI
jgi:predicted phosphodiesterase